MEGRKEKAESIKKIIKSLKIELSALENKVNEMEPEKPDSPETIWRKRTISDYKEMRQHFLQHESQEDLERLDAEHEMELREGPPRYSID